MATKPTTPVKVFYSYSHKDEKLRKRLQTHLTPANKAGLIEDWHDRMITPGTEWKGEIDKRLNSADIILLLISPDFMASDYCTDVEVKRAMERNDEETALVIPVILRPCDWTKAPFGKLQALPTNGKPAMKWKPSDDAFVNITEGILKAANKIRESLPPPQSPQPPPPPPIVDFVRRSGVIDGKSTDIVEHVTEKLLSPAAGNSWVTLWGLGGVGKTTLAAEIARKWAETYNGRFVFSKVETRADYTLESLLDHIFKQFGQPGTTLGQGETDAARAHALVAESPTLVVVDTYEKVAPGARQCIREWFEEARCVVLFTSHERVDWTRNIPVESMTAGEAHQFIKRLYIRNNVGDKFNEKIARRIFEAAEGRPILIEWLVSQITLAGAEPREVFKELKQGKGAAADRIFDRFFNLPQLGDDGRITLLALSLFVPDAIRNTSRKALGAVAGFPPDGVRLSKAIEMLLNLKLIKVTDDNNNSFKLEGLTLDMVAARLPVSPHAAGIWQRFVAYFKDPKVRSKERSNVIRAIQVAPCIHDWDSVVELYDSTEEFMHDAFRAWVKAIKLAEDDGEERIKLRSRQRPLIIEIYHRDKNDARKHYEAIETTLQQGVQRDWKQVVLSAVKFELGVFAYDRGEHELAIELMNQAMTLQKQIGRHPGSEDKLKPGHEFGVAMTSNNLGSVIATFQREGWAGEAKIKFEEALEFFKDERLRIAAAKIKQDHSPCNFAESEKGARFAQAVRLNMKWLERL